MKFVSWTLLGVAVVWLISRAPGGADAPLSGVSSPYATEPSERPVDGLAAGARAEISREGAAASDNGVQVLDETAYFSDGFENGDRSHVQNGATWTSARSGFNCRGIEVTDEAAYSGRYSLAFRYAGSGTARQNAFCQQDFDLGAEFSHVWYEWMMYVPENYENRVFEGQASNDKLFLAGDDPAYEGTAYHVKVVGEIWPADDATPTRPSRGGKFRPMYGTNGAYGGVLMSHWGMGMFDFLEPEDRGTWVQIRIEIAVADDVDSENGIWRVWKNGSLSRSFTSLDNAPVDGGLHGYRYHYFLGAHNAGYSDDTTFRMDDVRIFTSDPGWPR